MKAFVRFNFSGTSEVPTASSLKLERRNKRVLLLLLLLFQKRTEGRFSLTKEITSKFSKPGDAFCFEVLSNVDVFLLWELQRV